RLGQALDGETLGGQRAKDGFVPLVVPYEAKARLGDAAAPDLALRQHADPVAVPAAAMAGVKREAAETVEDRLAAIHLDRQRIMRAVPDHDVGAGIDRGMRDLAHIVEHLFAEPPMA